MIQLQQSFSQQKSFLLHNLENFLKQMASLFTLYPDQYQKNLVSVLTDLCH